MENIITITQTHDDDIKPCFVINKDTELKDDPTNGEEYLLKVITERKNMENVSKYEKDLSSFSLKQSVFVEEITTIKPAPQGLKPTKKWKMQQVTMFTEIREYTDALLVNKLKSPPPRDSKETTQSKSWKKFFANTPPTLTCVMKFSPFLVIKGLRYLTKSMDNIPKGTTITYKTGEWIYALLSCIHDPFDSDTVSAIRDLARKCSEIRSHINPDDEDAFASAVPLNIVICIVTDYFGQLDFAE